MRIVRSHSPNRQAARKHLIPQFFCSRERLSSPETVDQGMHIHDLHQTSLFAGGDVARLELPHEVGMIDLR